jgi:hypothetical protein
VRSEGTEISDRLNQVGLALTVAADEQVYPGNQGDVCRLIVAEVGETQVTNDHDSDDTGRSACPPKETPFTRSLDVALDIVGFRMYMGLPQQQIRLEEVLVVVRPRLVLRRLACDQHGPRLIWVVGLGE